MFDSGLTFQTAEPKRFQVATWVIQSATFHINGAGDFDFLGVKPCVFTDNVLFADDLARTCSGSGLVLEAGQPIRGVFTIVISSMTLRIANQPTLVPEEDFDGDGIANRYDNCPLIANPAQSDINGDGNGDACSMIDPRTGDLSLRDSDKDGFPDGIDNCPLVANPDQRDVVRGFDSTGIVRPDFIGDACEQFSDVVFPNGPLTLAFPVDTTASSQFTVLVVDFSSTRAVHCNADRTSCRIDPGVAGNPNLVLTITHE